MAGRTVEGLKGLDTVLRNLAKQVNEIEGRCLKGLIRGAIQIRRDMDNVPPVIPTDEGNLRAGYFVVTHKGGVPTKPLPFKGKGAAKAKADHESALVSAQATIALESTPALMMVFGFTDSSTAS